PPAHDEPALSLTAYRRVFHAPRAIAYNTEEERAMVHARFGNERVPSEIVGVGIEQPSDISGDRFRNGFGIDGPLLLYVGRVVQSKGCDQLFRDFVRWKDDGNGHRGTLVDLLFADGALRAKLGAGGRAFVERTYTWPLVVEKYRDLIAEVKARNS